MLAKPHIFTMTRCRVVLQLFRVASLHQGCMTPLMTLTLLFCSNFYDKIICKKDTPGLLSGRIPHLRSRCGLAGAYNF